MLEELGACLFFAVFVVALLAGLGWLVHVTTIRPPANPPAKDDDKEYAREITAVWLEIKQRYPYLPNPKIANTKPDTIMGAVREVLHNIPSYGNEVAEGLPVPALPQDRRSRHLWVVGKTGSGKSTFLEHAILGDVSAGRGVGVIAPEGEFFRARLLPMIAALEEAHDRECDLIYFAPGDTKNTLTLNPLAVDEGADPVRAAEDLVTIFRRLFAKDELGTRGKPILENALTLLTGQPQATVPDIVRLLTDETYRKQALTRSRDEYVTTFWTETYPRFPRGSHLPIATRLDRFLRPPAIRNTLCQSQSSFSIRDVLSSGTLLFVDLFGLSEENRLVIGQVLLSKIQLELMRREVSDVTKPPPFFLYVDEFQSIAGSAVSTWRELLSRGRKYGLGLTLANQYPAQLPTALTDELFGNVGSLVSFALGGKDAQTMRRELLHETTEGPLEPVPASALMQLPAGHAYARLAGGTAVHFHATPPARVSPSGRLTRRLIERAAGMRSHPTPSEPPADTGRERTPIDVPNSPEPSVLDTPRPRTPPAGPTPRPQLDKQALDYLALVATQPFLSVRERNQTLGVSAWKGQRIKRTLVNDRLARDVSINPGRRGGQFKLLELTTAGRSLLVNYNIAVSVGHGRGGISHQWWVQSISGWLAELGVEATIEDQSGGARVDLTFSTDHGDVAVEVEMSDGHVLENIRKDLTAGFSRVVSLLDNPGLLERVQEELRQTPQVTLGALQDFEALLHPLVSPHSVRPPNQNKEPSGRRARRRAHTRGVAPPPAPIPPAIPPDAGALSTPQAAHYLGLSPATLETLRSRGGGPRFVKLGRRVVYRREDLDAWLTARERSSTSDTDSE